MASFIFSPPLKRINVGERRKDRLRVRVRDGTRCSPIPVSSRQWRVTVVQKLNKLQKDLGQKLTYLHVTQPRYTAYGQSESGQSGTEVEELKLMRAVVPMVYLEDSSNYQSIKRLMTFCQCLYPTMPSKAVEFNSLANGSDLQSLLSEERVMAGNQASEEMRRLMPVPKEN